MARKKKSKVPPSVLKFSLIGVLILGVGFGLVNRAGHFLTHSEYFTIKSIVIDPELSFLNLRDVPRLKGQNIFTVKLMAVQKKLNFKYPEAADLKIVKRFPDQIYVVARKRTPFAQTRIDTTTVTLDEKGVVLSTKQKADNQLPLITGLRNDGKTIDSGKILQGRDLHVALKIIKIFQANRTLAHYELSQLNMENLSKIDFTLSNNLKVIVDEDKIQQKLEILSVLLPQSQVDLKSVKYIDLRFKEPIIGKK